MTNIKDVAKERHMKVEDLKQWISDYPSAFENSLRITERDEIGVTASGVRMIDFLLMLENSHVDHAVWDSLIDRELICANYAPTVQLYEKRIESYKSAINGLSFILKKLEDLLAKNNIEIPKSFMEEGE